MLADLGGRAVIAQTYLQFANANIADKVAVATDSEAIAEIIRALGGQAILTSANHESGTLRCAEALQILQAAGESYDLVANVQGDEPFVPPIWVDSLFTALAENTVFAIASLMQPIKTLAELHNPNIVKIISAATQNNNASPQNNNSPTATFLAKALYFSRAALPFLRDAPDNIAADNIAAYPFQRHIGIYAFRAETLAAIPQMPFSPLEQAERLEQLRWLEAGQNIGLLPTPPTNQPHISIDTLDDLQQARQYLAAQQL
jgi:3-deoxy-manno-octulosonate cytidylyltransferase (CMP-KDO synthetase)